MRVTSRMMVQNAIQYMEDNLARLSDLQGQVASGKTIQTASDDPATAALSLSLRSSLQTNASYIDSGAVTGDWLDANELALQQMVDLATSAQNTALQGVPDSQGPEERQALAQNIDSLLQQAVEVANSTHRGSYLFAGYQVTTQPFTYNGTDVTNNLASTTGPIQRAIGPGQTITVNIDGNTVLTPFFAALVAARDALNADDGAALQTALSSLQTAADGVSAARTTNGARSRQVDDTTDRLTKSQTALKDLLSKKEDASLAEAISLLNQQETVYQAVLEIGKRSIPASLFDFLS
jgi:flagellar hook-associated protein 3 FlgL